MDMKEMYSKYHILNYNMNFNVFQLMLTINQTKICTKGFPGIFTMKIIMVGYSQTKLEESMCIEGSLMLIMST